MWASTNFGTGIELAFDQVNYRALDREELIVKSASGIAKAGRTLAIMGPSGSGKTSLLNILSLRTVNKNVKGDITLNGCPVTKRGKVLMGYVMQRDIFFKDLTVRETLNFAVRLNVGASKTSAEKTEMVEEVIEKLGLGKCQNTRVGDPMNRGISGGELKRLNVACELLNSPYVLFLDEPTSGLDSTAALSLCQELVEMCRERNLTVVMAIHQPSSQLFQTFDDLILMMNGNIVYHGAAKQIGPHLANMGYPCPVGFNIADYFTDLLNDPEMEAPLLEAYQPPIPELCLNCDPKSLGLLIRERLASRPGVASRVATLCRRNFKKDGRGVLTPLDIFHSLLIGSVAGALWFGRLREASETSYVDHVGLVQFSCNFWMFVPIYTALNNFPPERDVIAKEREAKTYPISSYFFAKTLADIPLLVATPSLFFVVIFFMTGFPIAWSSMGCWLALVLQTQVAFSIGSLVSSIVKSFKNAAVIVSFITLLLMILGGFYVAIEEVPPAIRWVRRISFLEYSIASFMSFLFDGRSYECADPTTFPECPYPGQLIREDIYEKSLPAWASMLVLLGFYFAVRSGIYASLRWSRLLRLN